MRITERSLAGMLVTALLLAAMTAMSACGGDDDGGNGGNGGGVKAEGPEEYAQQVCDTLGDRFNELNTLMEGGDFDDPEQLQEAISDARPVIEDLANDLGDIEPPSEIEDWHNGLVTTLSQASELFGKLGDVLDKPLDEALAAMEELAPELEEMQAPFEGVTDLPQEYQDAFENEPACQELDILGES